VQQHRTAGRLAGPVVPEDIAAPRAARVPRRCALGARQGPEAAGARGDRKCAMTARLLIETNDYNAMEDWIFRLDEHDIIRGESFDLAVRSARDAKKPRFTFALNFDTPAELAGEVQFFRALGRARSGEVLSMGSDSFEFASPTE